MSELFMRKLTVNPPPMTFIEVNRPSVRLDHAKAKRFVAATPYLKFRFREQICTDAKAAAVASDPQITDPFILRRRYTDDLIA